MVPLPGIRRTRAMASLRRPTAAPGTLRTARGVAGAASTGLSVVKLEGALSMESAILAMSVNPWGPALLSELVEGVRRGLLGSVGVLGARVDLELLELGGAKGVLREHAADGLLDRARRVLLEHLAVGRGGEAARVAGVAVRLLLRELCAGEGDLLGVDDDDEVAVVHVGGEGGLVLSAEEGSRVAGEATEDDVGRVDHEPVVLELALPGRVSARHGGAFLSRC